MADRRKKEAWPEERDLGTFKEKELQGYITKKKVNTHIWRYLWNITNLQYVGAVSKGNVTGAKKGHAVVHLPTRSC